MLARKYAARCSGLSALRLRSASGRHGSHGWPCSSRQCIHKHLLTGLLEYLRHSAGTNAQRNEPKGGDPMHVPKCIEPSPNAAFNTLARISAGAAPRIARAALSHRRGPIAGGAANVVFLQVFV